MEADRPILIAYDGSGHARAAVGRAAAVLGSTALGVLNHAQRPVLVVAGD